MSDYELLDSGDGRKLERFGPYILDRPSLQSVWRPKLGKEEWNRAHAKFTREPDGLWEKKRGFPDEWAIEVEGIKFKLAPTDFGHLGIFPEQRSCWKWIQNHLGKGANVLNLFAYSGGSTMAAALAKAQATHLDASKKMCGWARENAALNSLEEAPVRWIVDDVKKFLKREVRRKNRYDAIILDPPSFGRGAKGEVFKIEKDIQDILSDCKELLSEQPLFILLTCHSPGFTPIAMSHLLAQFFPEGDVEAGEMVLEGDENVFPLPSGSFARWRPC
jgi:23S rRNA (cytosine1962-C5)-methyltransferase